MSMFERAVITKYPRAKPGKKAVTNKSVSSKEDRFILIGRDYFLLPTQLQIFCENRFLRFIYDPTVLGFPDSK